jgi:peptidyl-prolyl cis-trans isomerase C
MSEWRRTRVAVASVLAIVGASVPFFGCNDKALEASASVDGGKRLGAAVTPEQAAKVLAKVGDHNITLGDFVAALEHMDQFDRLRYQSPERRRELLSEMINMQVLADEAIAKGYDKDPQTQQEIRGILRDAMLAEAHKGAPTPNEISEADARAYYDKNRGAFKDSERRRLSVIVLLDEAAANAVAEAAKKTSGSGTAGGGAAQWGELVRTKSVEPGAKANVPVDLVGDVGLVSPPDDVQAEPNAKVPPEVRAAVFQLAKIGDVTEKPIKASDHKFYIVRLTQKTDAHERTYAEAERSIRVKLVQEKIREKEEALLAQLKTTFPVQIDDAVLATVRVDLPEGGLPPLQADAALPVSPTPPSPLPRAPRP